MKKIFFAVLMVFSMLVVGCGIDYQPGEENAQQMLKKKYGDRRITDMVYKFDGDNRFAYMDYHVDGRAGINRTYFTFDDEYIYMINTGNIEDRIVEKLAKEDPANFRQNIDKTKKMNIAISDNRFEIEYFFQSLDRVRDGHGSYYDWTSLQEKSHEFNRKMKKVLDVYNDLPPIVQESIDLPFDKYIIVNVYGSSYDYYNCSGDYQFTKDYPETY